MGDDVVLLRNPLMLTAALEMQPDNFDEILQGKAE